MLSQIENDKRGASNTTIANLSQALFTTSDYLLELTDEESFKQSNKMESELQKQVEFVIFCFNQGINRNK